MICQKFAGMFLLKGKNKARDIGLCEPQPDNHVAWSRFVPGNYLYYTTGICKCQTKFVNVRYTEEHGELKTLVYQQMKETFHKVRNGDKYDG